MILRAIYAISENNKIGNYNKLPWKIPEELELFRKKTLNKNILMGRNTWDSLPIRPLPKRQNIVLTTKNNLNGAIVVNSLDDLFKLELEEVWVIGGKLVYEQLIPYCSELHITRIHDYYEGNIDEPQYKKEDFEKTESKVYLSKLKVYYTVEVYRRTI